MTLLAVIFAVAFAAQAPDLNGTWKMIPERSGSPTQTPPVNDMTLSVTSNSEEVRLQWLSGATPDEVIYPVVPPPEQPAEPLGAGMKRAYWDGNKLVVERGGTINGQTVSMKQSLTLDPSSRELILERVVIVQHGYTLKGTPNYATVKDVFARTSQ